MKYRQREETIRGESPYLDVKLSGDGTSAKVRVLYSRTVDAKGVRTTTFGTLDLGELDPDDLACVGRTVMRRLVEARLAHDRYLTELIDSVEAQNP